MNPIVSHIFSNLDADHKAISRIFKTLTAQRKVNNTLTLGLCILAGVSFIAEYENARRDAKIAKYERDIAAILDMLDTNLKANALQNQEIDDLRSKIEELQTKGE